MEGPRRMGGLKRGPCAWHRPWRLSDGSVGWQLSGCLPVPEL
jgi:hypothetical protein